MKPTFVQPVRTQSSREGGRPKLIVLHTTEGSDHPSSDLTSLATFFNDSLGTEHESSAHVANDEFGFSIRMVPDSMKSWAVCSYNPYALNIEQIAFASFTREDWFRRDKQLSNTAAWCAEWSNLWGIPLQSGSASTSGLSISRSGIVQHKDLGAIGCGHSDCGSGYPQRYVTLLARLIVEEHHNKRPNSRTAKRLRLAVNQRRKHYGLPLFK